AAAGRRGLPDLAIENYSQLQAKKEAPAGAPENLGFTGHPASAGMTASDQSSPTDRDCSWI
ncbi:MAG: hypothetical protein ACREB7_09870, partial [Sphingopyxis sp.]|uniref:hypothetical protein n=1 Tax=Sphingopyxis sp. TaxID=1908224 RepID=UPI003D6D1A28